MISLINKQFIKAIQNNQIDKVKNLLDQGADIHDDNDWALRESAFYGYLEIVKFLLTQGANIHADDDRALKWSAIRGHLEIVKFLIAKGANIHADDEPLRCATRYGHLEVVKFLVTQGANIHVNNDEIFKTAIENENEPISMLLNAFLTEEKLLVAASESTGMPEKLGNNINVKTTKKPPPKI